MFWFICSRLLQDEICKCQFQVQWLLWWVEQRQSEEIWQESQGYSGRDNYLSSKILEIHWLLSIQTKHMTIHIQSE